MDVDLRRHAAGGEDAGTALVVIMAVLTPAVIIGESCPHLHPCRLLLSLSRWAGWSYPIRSRSPRPCSRSWPGWSIRAGVAGSGIRWSWCSPLRYARSRPGARSFVAAAEWVADLPAEVAAALGVADRCPSESAIRRLLGRVDADRFDTVIGGFVQGLCASAAPAGRRRVLAVDGKTVRGSRHT